MIKRKNRVVHRVEHRRKVRSEGWAKGVPSKIKLGQGVPGMCPRVPDIKW